MASIRVFGHGILVILARGCSRIAIALLRKGKEAQELHHARMRLLKAEKEAVQAEIRVLDALLQVPSLVSLLPLAN